VQQIIKDVFSVRATSKIKKLSWLLYHYKVCPQFGNCLYTCLQLLCSGKILTGQIPISVGVTKENRIAYLVK